MKRLAVLVGKFALFLASMAFLTGLSLFIVGAYLATMPVLRLSPRNGRVQAVTGVAVAFFALVRAYGKGEDDVSRIKTNTSMHETGDTYPYEPTVYLSLMRVHRESCTIFAADPALRAQGCTCDMGAAFLGTPPPLRTDA